MSNYNRNLRRFQRQYETEEGKFGDSIGAIAELMKYNKGQGTGLLGLGSFGREGTAPAFDSLSGAIAARNAGDTKAGALVKGAYKGIAPDDWKMATKQFAEQNVGTPGQEGTGLLGSVQDIGQGLGKLDQALGGYGKKALGKAGSFAMDKLGGEAIKNFGSKMLAETGLSSLAGSAGAVMGALGPIGSAIGIAQAGKELVDATVDQYEGLESGIAAGETMQTDLSSRATEAKTNLFSKNKDLSKMMEDRKGKLSGAVGAQAEKVLSATDTMAGKTGLETSSNPYKKTQEGLIQSYLDSGDALQKQMENIKLSNIEGYKAQKAGLIAEGQDLQASIDDMQSQKDDMEWQYKTAKAVKFW